MSSSTTTTEIQAAASQPSAPGAGSTEIQTMLSIPKGRAILRQASPGFAYLKPEDKKAEGKPYALYGQVSGKIWNWRGGLEGHYAEQLDKQVSELWKAGDLLEKHWNMKISDCKISLGRLQITSEGHPSIGQAEFMKKIEEEIQKVHPHVSNIAIDFSDKCLRFIEDGELSEIGKDDLPKSVLELLNFLETWQDAHETVMLILGIRSWHTRLGTEGNRAVHGDTPFTLGKNTTLDAYMPQTHEEFLKHHMATLLSNLPEDIDRELARERISQVHHFTTAFKENINEQLDLLRAQQPAPPKEEIEPLEKIREKLEAIKGTELFCLYWATAFLGDGDLAAMTIDEKSRRAQLLQNALMNLFENTGMLNPEKWSSPLNWHKVISKGKPTKDDWKSLAIQTGDLYYHSDLDYASRFDSSGAKRMVRPAITEFVMNNFIHLANQQYVDDLRSFGMKTMPPQIQQTVRDAINRTRQVVVAPSP